MRAARRAVATAVVCSAIAAMWAARRVRGHRLEMAVAGRLARFAKAHRGHEGVTFLDQGPLVGFYCPACRRGEAYDVASHVFGTVRPAEAEEVAAAAP